MCSLLPNFHFWEQTEMSWSEIWRILRILVNRNVIVLWKLLQTENCFRDRALWTGVLFCCRIRESFFRLFFPIIFLSCYSFSCGVFIHEDVTVFQHNNCRHVFCHTGESMFHHSWRYLWCKICLTLSLSVFTMSAVIRMFKSLSFRTVLLMFQLFLSSGFDRSSSSFINQKQTQVK